MSSSDHYSLGQKIDELTEWAAGARKKLGVQLLRFGRKNIYPVLCYRGMSGVAHATALAIELNRNSKRRYGMCYVRKPGEKSHGDEVEYNVDSAEAGDVMVLVFVDDFVAAGKTRDAVLAGAESVVLNGWNGECICKYYIQCSTEYVDVFNRNSHWRVEGSVKGTI